MWIDMLYVYWLSAWHESVPSTENCIFNQDCSCFGPSSDFVVLLVNICDMDDALGRFWL